MAEDEIVVYKRGEVVTPPIPKIIPPELLQIIMLDDLKVAVSRVAKTLTPATRFVDLARSSVWAAAWLNVLEKFGAGQLEQFHVRAPNTDFRILIIVDGISIFSKTYDETTDDLTYNWVLTCFYQKYNSEIGLTYMTLTESPYNVRFDYLTLPTEHEKTLTESLGLVDK
ncbi:unnamed protein product, partial [marine sediment metagenome]